MKEIIHVVRDREGIHARPAGMLAKECRKFTSKVAVSCNGRTEDLTGIFAVLKMGIKYGEQLVITVEGKDEEAAAEALRIFLNTNL